jgi:anion-transporting  ArsA/GET3 family ATPase
VAEVAARDDVSRVLAGEASGRFVERAVGEGLHHISIDPQSALEEYLRDQLPLGGLADLLGSRMFALTSAATPGLRELLTIGKVWELAQLDRRTPGAQAYDLVILDAPATGHGVAVLAAPATFVAAAGGGPIARQAGKIDAMIRDPERTAVVAVATPEEMPVNETVSLREAMRGEIGLDLARAYVNGVLPRRFTAAEERALAAAPPSAATRAALTSAARARAHRSQVDRLRRKLAGVRVCALPFLLEPEVGPDALERLAREVDR